MINITKTSDKIVVTYNQFTTDGKTEIVTRVMPFEEELYNQLVDLRRQAENPPAGLKDYKSYYVGIIGTISELTENQLGDVLTRLTDELFVDNKGKVYLKHSGKVSKVAMPTEFVEWIKNRIDNDEDIKPIIKFWIRLLANPNVRTNNVTRFVSDLCAYIMMKTMDQSLYEKFLAEGYTEEIASEMAMVYQTPLTDEGLIHTYKVVDVDYGATTNEWKIVNGEPVNVVKPGFSIDAMTGKISDPPDAESWVFVPRIYKHGGDKWILGGVPDQYVYQVGKRAVLPDWDMVSTNTNNINKGFWLGGKNWVKSYETKHDATLNCFVCPSQIGVVASWYVENGAIVVKEFFPHSIKDREFENREFYTSSKYGAMLDAEWAIEKTKIMEKLQFEKEEAMRRYDDKMSTLL